MSGWIHFDPQYMPAVPVEVLTTAWCALPVLIWTFLVLQAIVAFLNTVRTTGLFLMTEIIQQGAWFLLALRAVGSVFLTGNELLNKISSTVLSCVIEAYCTVIEAYCTMTSLRSWCPAFLVVLSWASWILLCTPAHFLETNPILKVMGRVGLWGVIVHIIMLQKTLRSDNDPVFRGGEILREFGPMAASLVFHGSDMSFDPTASGDDVIEYITFAAISVLYCAGFCNEMKLEKKFFFLPWPDRANGFEPTEFKDATEFKDSDKKVFEVSFWPWIMGPQLWGWQIATMLVFVDSEQACALMGIPLSIVFFPALHHGFAQVLPKDWVVHFTALLCFGTTSLYMFKPLFTTFVAWQVLTCTLATSLCCDAIKAEDSKMKRAIYASVRIFSCLFFCMYGNEIVNKARKDLHIKHVLLPSLLMGRVDSLFMQNFANLYCTDDSKVVIKGFHYDLKQANRKVGFIVNHKFSRHTNPVCQYLFEAQTLSHPDRIVAQTVYLFSSNVVFGIILVPFFNNEGYSHFANSLHMVAGVIVLFLFLVLDEVHIPDFLKVRRYGLGFVLLLTIAIMCCAWYTQNGVNETSVQNSMAVFGSAWYTLTGVFSTPVDSSMPGDNKTKHFFDTGSMILSDGKKAEEKAAQEAARKAAEAQEAARKDAEAQEAAENAAKLEAEKNTAGEERAGEEKKAAEPPEENPDNGFWPHLIMACGTQSRLCKSAIITVGTIGTIGTAVLGWCTLTSSCA